MDETSTFRQLPILHRDRSLAVTVLENPETKIVSYFVMIRHPFGLTPSVHNYNRRAAVLTGFLASEFCLLCQSYYDDRFGLTRPELAESEARLVEQVCVWLGVDVNGKTEFGQGFDLLGVSLDCVSGRLEIKLELRAILREGKLAPGAAAKLRGKLQFVAGHFAGRHGRAFLAPFAERLHTFAVIGRCCTFVASHLGFRFEAALPLRTSGACVKGIYPAPDIHEHFMIHNGYGKLRTSSRTTSTTLSTLRPIA